MSQFVVTPDLHASQGKRILNFIIDYIAQMLFAALLSFTITFIMALIDYSAAMEWADRVENMGAVLEYILGFLMIIIYYMTFEGIISRSVGKFITGTKVVLEDGSKPTLYTIFIRTISRCIPFEMFSFLGVSGRGWHDRNSRTFVVNVKDFEEKIRLYHDFNEIGSYKEE